MSKTQTEKNKGEMPIDGLLLECNKDRYKLSYAALRWAREIKQKENLPDSVLSILSRSLREILTGKVSLKEIEKLPFIFRTPASAPAPAQAPTLSLSVAPSDSEGQK